MKKLQGLVAAGVACLALGLAWSPLFPIIKNLWTSSYVLIAAGWSLLLVALFYFVIDIQGARRWAFPFVVIGMNAITIYVAQEFINFPDIAKFFLGGLAMLAGGAGPVSWRSARSPFAGSSCATCIGTARSCESRELQNCRIQNFMAPPAFEALWR